MAVDFHQERKWKKAAAKMLAESARDYVSTWQARKKARREAEERQRRAIAKFAADKVMAFWRDLSLMTSDGEPEPAAGSAHFGSVLKKQAADSDDDDYDEVIGGDTLSEEESTIEEQEVRVFCYPL